MFISLGPIPCYFLYKIEISRGGMLRAYSKSLAGWTRRSSRTPTSEGLELDLIRMGRRHWIQTPIFSDLRCTKLGLRTPESKNGHHFSSPANPKIGELDTDFISISLLGEFWATLTIGNFWLIFADFPISNPKIKTLCCTRSIFEIKIWFLANGFLTYRDS